MNPASRKQGYDFVHALGAAIRKRRVSRRISMRTIRRATGLCLGSMSEIELGDREPKLSTLVPLAKVLDWTLPQMMAEATMIAKHATLSRSGLEAIRIRRTVEQRLAIADEPGSSRDVGERHGVSPEYVRNVRTWARRVRIGESTDSDRVALCRRCSA